MRNTYNPLKLESNVKEVAGFLREEKCTVFSNFMQHDIRPVVQT